MERTLDFFPHKLRSVAGKVVIERRSVPSAEVPPLIELNGCRARVRFIWFTFFQ